MTRKPYAIFASFLLNLAFLLGMAFFVGFFYELSDDWFIARNIANGQYNQVFCSYFIQRLSGFVQEWIYPVNAFMLLQIVFSFISLTTICGIYFDVFNFKIALLFSMLTECALAVNFYSIITFSKTAGILATAGALTMLWAHHGNKNIGFSIYGFVLVVLGSFYRMKIFYAVAAVFCCCIAAILLAKIWQFGWKSLPSLLREIVTVRNICLVLGLLICVFGCNSLSTQLIMDSDEGLAYYKEYNHLRSTLVDYPLPEYEKAEEAFKKIGVSENDYEMLKNWYFDDQGFGDMETFQGIIDIQQSFEYSDRAVLGRVKEMVRTAYKQIRGLKSEGILMLTFLGCAAMVFILFGDRSWMYAGALLMGIGILYTYLWIGGRVKFRAVLPLWVAVMACLFYITRFLRFRVWMSKLIRRFPKTVTVFSTVISVVCCGVLLYFTATTVPRENKIVNDYDYDALNEYIVSQEDKTFVLSYDSYKYLRNRTVLEDPLYIGPDPVFDKCLYYGSPYYAHPSYNALLASHGVTCLYTAVIDSEEFLYVDRRNQEIDMMLAYLEEQYGNGKTYSCELVNVLNNHYIYRIRTGGKSQYIKLHTQPEDVSVPEGEMAKVALDVVGVGLTYQWYFANEGDSTFTYTDTYDGRVYFVDMNSKCDGRQVYCVITDAYGNRIQTDTVTLHME